MIARRKAGLLVPLVLLTACGTVLWMIYDWWQTPSGSSQVARTKPAKVQDIGALAKELKFAMPPISQFDGILERPIFAPSRRGVAGSTTTVVVSQELKLRLAGTVITDVVKLAILMPLDGGERLRLREGEDYRGWNLARVKEDMVVFRRDDAEEQLMMDFKEKPKQQTKTRRDRRTRAQRAKQQNQRAQKQNQRVQQQIQQQNQANQPKQAVPGDQTEQDDGNQ